MAGGEICGALPHNPFLMDAQAGWGGMVLQDWGVDGWYWSYWEEVWGTWECWWCSTSAAGE